MPRKCQTSSFFATGRSSGHSGIARLPTVPITCVLLPSRNLWGGLLLQIFDTLCVTMNLPEIQSSLRDLKLDAWLFYDHHHRDPIAERILGLDPHAHITRRWYYVIPAHGEPHKLVHRIEQGRLDALPGGKTKYSSWQELQSGLEMMLAPYHRIAMQYSPRNAIMYVAMVDAGTVELLREMGKTIVSSADLVSQFEAVLSEEQIASHYEAQRAL